MRTLAVLCLVLLSRVQAAPQLQDLTSALGASSADVSVANDSLRRVSSLVSVLSQESPDSSSSFSASSSSSSFRPNVASEKSSSDSSPAASSYSSSSLSSSATLDKSSVESSAAFSSSSIPANAASEKSSVDSASASLASSSAQSSSDSDVHHVDSGKSEAVSGFSSSASSVAAAGNAGVQQPEVIVDSVKAEQHEAAAAPPATSGLTVEAVDTSSPDTDIPLKKVPVYVPVEYSAAYQPENFFNPYSSVSRYSPYLTGPYGAIPYRTAAMPWYRLVSPEVPILTLYSGESQGADVQREIWSPWAPMPYAKVGLACAHPESRWGYAPPSGLVAASPLPYSPVAHPTYRLHHPAAVLDKTLAPWSHFTTVEPSLEIAKAAGPWTHVVAAEQLPLSPVALPTYRLHLPAATPAAVLGKTSDPWTHVVATAPSLEIAKAAGPWSPVYGPVQKLYIPDNLALPEHIDLGKTSSFSVSPWIPLRGFAGHSAWSSGHETAPVVGIEKASPVPSPWISFGSPSNVDGIANVVPWAVPSAGAPWGSLRNRVDLAKSPVYSASSGLDLARRSSSVDPVWIPVSNAGITKSAPAEVEFPWIPLEASSPMNTGKSSPQFPLVWNPVLEQTLKEQRASGYPGSTYTSPLTPPSA